MNVHLLSDARYSPSRWIQAHAGSGKTYQLVQHIIGLLVEGETPGSIVCMTYTKAAAAEMQGRLQSRLGELRRMPEPELIQALEAILGYVPRQEHIQRARELLIALLDAVPGVQFFTIHSFCQSLLSRFPLEAGISASFTLLDDRQSRQLLARSFHGLLDAAMEDAALRDAFSVLQLAAREGAVEALLQEGLAFRQEWQAWFADGSPDPLAASIDAYFDVASIPSIDVQMEARYDGAWRATAAGIASLLLGGSSSEIAIGSPIAAWLPACDPHAWDAYSLAFVTKTGTARKTLFTKGFRERYPAQAAWLADEQAFTLKLQHERAVLAAAALSKSLSLLMYRLLAIYEDAKAGLRALDYDDLLFKVQAMLANASLRPWIMYKLDQQVRHLLVDEAQDTSPAQWAIIEMLREELWQEGVQHARSLLVVGDIKQSIYSFQGAVPELFLEQRQSTGETFAQLGIVLEDVPLATSRRTAELLLTVVDQVLMHPAVRSACLTEGQLPAHRTVYREQAAIISCWPAMRKAESEKPSPFEPADAYVVQAHARQLWAQQVAKRIATWLREGRMLAARGRAVRAGDILILVQTRKIAPLLIQALEAEHIAVAGLDRLRLGTHLAVRDHLAFIEWALYAEDDYHLAIALRSPLGGVSEEELFVIAHDRGEMTLWQALLARLPAHPCIQRFLSWKEVLLACAPDISLQRMHADGGLRHAYATRFGDEVLEILDAFLTEASRYVEGGGASLRGFASWLTEDGTEIKRDQEQQSDKVRIMTVHGAKGLEAPVVILADAFDRPSMARETLLFTPFKDGRIPLVKKGDALLLPAVAEAFDRRKQAKFAEYYRLLYVALTRAEDELYIGGVDSGGKGDAANDPMPHWYGVVSEVLKAMGGNEDEAQGIMLYSAQGSGVGLRRDKQADTMRQAEVLPEWVHRVAPVPPPRDRIYSPSSLVPYVPAVGRDAGGNAAERGVIYHRVLQWMELYAPADKAELHAWIKREAPHWNAKQWQEAAERLWHLYSMPEWRWMWESPSHREVNIAGTLDIHGVPTRFAGQIDRLVMLPERRVILDYKTSARVPDQEHIPESYKIQMLAYKKLLEADGSGLSVSVGLLYTAGPVLYMLDEELATLPFPSLDAA